MKKVLITGVGGLIGSHLANYYLNNGWCVIGVDNFSSSNNNSKHIINLEQHNNFHLWCMDLKLALSLQREKDIDIIYHLACPASPKYFKSHAMNIIDVSTNGTIAMINLAKYHRCPIVIASSSEVYGSIKKNITDIKESYWGEVNSFGPRSAYDESKRMIESICYNYINSGSYTNIRIPRIFNTYGPHMDKNDGRVISNFITNALENKSLKIHGDKDLSRAFNYVSDTISGLIKLSESNYNKPINIGNPNIIDINMLAKTIIKLTQSKSKIITAAPVKDDPIWRLPNISLAEKTLNWSPKISLNDGLIKTIKYFENDN